MKNTRLLLPFTERIDLAALACAARFAKSQHATLVPLALIPLSKQQKVEEPRLEAIEQANDFLEAMKYQAARAGVEVEPCTLWTFEVVRSIRLLAQEMMCGGILLFLREGMPVLLSSEVVKCLLAEVSTTLLIIRLSPDNGRTWQISSRLHRVFVRIRGIFAHQKKSSLFQASAIAGGTMIALEPGEISSQDHVR